MEKQHSDRYLTVARNARLEEENAHPLALADETAVERYVRRVIVEQIMSYARTERAS